MPWKDESEGQRPHAAGGPWGSGSGGKNDGGSPWNRPGGGGSGGGGGGNGGDIEDQMRRMQERFRRGIGGRGGRGGGGGRTVGPFGFLIVALVALIAWLATGVVVVGPGERAVIFRFGEYQTDVGSGLHVHLPVPIERHELVDVAQQREIRIGDTREESLMITEDENIVDMQFSVFWRVKADAPEEFVLFVRDPEQAVRMVAESVMREVVGKTELQGVITTQRQLVQTEVGDQVQALLDAYRAGVEIREIQIARSDPPQQVIEAFNDVNRAEQDAAAVINEATQFANRIVPEARGQAQRILQQAEGYRDRVIADASGEAARFTSIYEEYRQAPQVTRERMYLETLERVLANTEKTLLDNESGAVPYLPLERTPRP